MMVNDGIKKEQSIKLLLVIVEKKRLYFAHPTTLF